MNAPIIIKAFVVFSMSVFIFSAFGTPDADEPRTTTDKRVPGISEEELLAWLPKDGKKEQPIAPEALNSLLASASHMAPLGDDEVKFDSRRVGTSNLSREQLIAAAADRAKRIHDRTSVRSGDTKQNYDLILQIGHFKRKTGKTGGSGRLVSEQQIAALVGVELLEKLASVRNDGADIKTLLIGADNITPGLKTRIFLALHTDAAENSCAVGPSVGYHNKGDAKGMHGIAVALACTLRLKDAAQFMRDNYTKNLSDYYAYSQIDSEQFEGVLEMSELTCPSQENLLLERVDDLTTNLAVAIQFALRGSK